MDDNALVTAPDGFSVFTWLESVHRWVWEHYTENGILRIGRC